MAQLAQNLAQSLATEVTSGRRRPGDAVPSVRELAAGAGCAPGTAARALGILREAGMVDGAQRHTAVFTSDAVARARGLLTGDDTIRIAGSDDPAFDLLLAAIGSRAQRRGRHERGSVSGLAALAAGEVDAAAVHLRDATTGRSNDTFVRHLLGGRPATLVHLWRREQGIVVAKGNPVGIDGVTDLHGKQLSWRGPGTGSRLLLNRLLRESGTVPQAATDIADSHLGVAVSVASGAVDAGLATRSAATAVDADFVPLEREDFELAVNPDAIGTVTPLLEALAATRFRSQLAAMSGYDTSNAGAIRQAA